jgi:membrane associated rhomboid family serine protease
MLTALYLCALAGPLFVGSEALRRASRRFPYLTLFLCLALAGCLALQLLFPGILSALERDAARVYAGEWWRLFTALFFQDGGLAGGISNIFLLAWVGSIAEQLWSRGRWLTLYFGTGILVGVAALAWQPVGAGNSIALFGLAGGIIVHAAPRLRRKREAACVVLSALCALILLTGRDIHGLAFCVGAAFSAVLAYAYGRSDARTDGRSAAADAAREDA